MEAAIAESRGCDARDPCAPCRLQQVRLRLFCAADDPGIGPSLSPVPARFVGVAEEWPSAESPPLQRSRFAWVAPGSVALAGVGGKVEEVGEAARVADTADDRGETALAADEVRVPGEVGDLGDEIDGGDAACRDEAPGSGGAAAGAEEAAGDA